MIHFVHSVNLDEGGVSSSVLALDKAIRKNDFASSICTSPADYQITGNENIGMIAHGLWQWPSLEAMRIHQKNKVPYLVFPHGMLDPWFKKEYPFKHFKKQIYWWLKQGKILSRANAVCFTTEEEKLLAQPMRHLSNLPVSLELSEQNFLQKRLPCCQARDQVLADHFRTY